MHSVDPIHVGHREVHVEATAPFVVPRLAHERGEHFVAMGDVLDRRLFPLTPYIGLRHTLRF